MRWLFTSWGSAGDLHPFLALARGLQARGHTVTLAGPSAFGAQSQQAGVRFVATCDWPPPDFTQRHPKIFSTRFLGLESLRTLVRHGIAPGLDTTYAVLQREAPAHDVLLAHHFVFAAAALAEETGMPWATISLAPGSVPSHSGLPGGDYTPMSQGRLFQTRCRLQWAVGRGLVNLLADPEVNAFRRRHRLPATRGAVFDALSPTLNLQLYSELFAPCPRDWGPPIRYGGFCFYDPPEATLTPETEAFLQAGAAPILFTLGTAAVTAPGPFYADAIAVCQALGQRGILLYGGEENRPRALPESILALPYAAYGLIMPRVRAVVHQGGIGTVSHSLRAGIPSLVCPFAFDQPNNGRRLEHLGVARLIHPHDRHRATIERELRALLAGNAAQIARDLGKRLREEDGVAKSCAVLEEVFPSASTHSNVSTILPKCEADSR